MRVQNRQRGFSLIEMLTVIAIIGSLSLVMVPAFINYQRSQQVKNTMRQFTSDLRGARQRAVTQTSFVRVTIVESDPVESQRVYLIEESRDRGANYGEDAEPDSWFVRKELDKIAWFSDDMTFTFLPNGTVQEAANQTVTIASANRFGKSSYDVTVGLAGKVSVQ